MGRGGAMESLPKMPSERRLATAAMVAKRLRDRRFRDAVVKGESGARHIVIADPEDTLREVFARVDAINSPATVCVPIGGGGIFSITVRETEGNDATDYQECGPETELGMLVELLAATRSTITIVLKHPVRLELAFA